ncbi:hypothetical protein [Pedobacter gandavensis]|uniref:Uncharacterized protein n=1 Tax=Pedobacter gandavensis TaxID=2679963 RepID=A0ABR6F1B8_9SPHI|nr:hypothetical protein [Pedobacter gandavensis]MBB2151328.1 hypothetical protein [Pedobacter gandavensis]
MKKNILFAALLCGVLLSCKKKSFTEEPIPPTLPPTELGYSKLTTEQNKQALEQNGLDFIKKINTLPDEKFITLIERLGDLDLEALSNTIIGRELETIAFAGKNKQVEKLFSAVTTNNVAKTHNLSEYYGIYNWDLQKKEWTKTPSTSKFEVHYPSTATSNTNDALLTVSYTASKATISADGEAYELPAATNVSLSVSGKEELKLTGLYEYKINGTADATPTKADIRLNLGSFQLVVTAENDTKVLTSRVTLAKDSKELLNLVSTANLNGSYPNLEDLETPAEVIKDANMTFDVMNIRLTGQANIKIIQDDYDANDMLPEKESREKQVATMNKNSSLFAVYKDKNEIFAKNEFVMVSDTYTYTDYNPATGKWEPVTRTYYDLEPRLVFNDESKMSLKTFFGKGFTKFIDEFEIFTKKF